MKYKHKQILPAHQMTFTSRMVLLSCQQWLDRNPALAKTVALIMKGKHKAKRRNLEHYNNPYAKVFNPVLCGFYNVYLEYLCKIRYGALDLNRRGIRSPAFYRDPDNLSGQEEVLTTTNRQFTTIIWNVDGPLLEGFKKVMLSVRKNLNKKRNNNVELSAKNQSKNIPEPKRKNKGYLSSFIAPSSVILAMRKLPWKFKSDDSQRLLELNLKDSVIVQKIFSGEIPLC